MSWLSKALKNNSVKIGLVLAGATIGKEYLYGDYREGIINPASGEFIKGAYTGDNFAAKTLNFLGATPFKDTGVGQSFLGSAVEYMRPEKGVGIDKAISALRQNIGLPQAPQLGLASGNQNFRSGQGFQPGRAQLFNVGANGRTMAALNNASTQEYIAQKVSGLNIPMAQALPSPSTGSGTIRTTSMARRGYKKLGLSGS